ncbi:MAG TPA: nuclear transport factor 2 family protein [Rhizomicrobium sp.]|nr:nuclear transport factor 2 family protein [Rhizomicrobium sp.]
MRGTIIGAVLSVLVLALAPSSASASSNDFAQLEDRLSDALAAYDAKAVDSLWDDSFVFVWPSGKRSTKAERIAGLTKPRAPGPQLVSHNDSVDVIYEDDRVAVVLVRSTWMMNDKAIGASYLATHVWIRRGDRWRLLAAQVAQIKS